MNTKNIITNTILGIIFLLGLIYLIYPGPSSIYDVPALPDSLKSTEPGDTYQNPNIAAYFSNLRRSEVTNFYKDYFSYIKIFGFTIPPVATNHPPEESFQFIRDQQKTTYLEQFSYPLRDAIFVNGYEPFDIYGKPFDGTATIIVVNELTFDTKTTLRYYPSSVIARILTYILIWISMILLYKLFIKSLKEKI